MRVFLHLIFKKKIICFYSNIEEYFHLANGLNHPQIPRPEYMYLIAVKLLIVVYPSVKVMADLSVCPPHSSVFSGRMKIRSCSL